MFDYTCQLAVTCGNFFSGQGLERFRVGGKQGGAAPGAQGGLRGARWAWGTTLDGGLRTAGAPPDGRSMSSRGKSGRRKSGREGGGRGAEGWVGGGRVGCGGVGVGGV